MSSWARTGVYTPQLHSHSPAARAGATVTGSPRGSLPRRASFPGEFRKGLCLRALPKHACGTMHTAAFRLSLMGLRTAERRGASEKAVSSPQLRENMSSRGLRPGRQSGAQDAVRTQGSPRRPAQAVLGPAPPPARGAPGLPAPHLDPRLLPSCSRAIGSLWCRWLRNSNQIWTHLRPSYVTLAFSYFLTFIVLLPQFLVST